MMNNGTDSSVHMEMESSYNMSTRQRLFLFVDAIVVFINLANYYTIINNLLFTPKRSVNTVIITVLNCLFLFFRKRSRFSIFPHDRVFVIYLLVIFVNIVSSVISGTLIPGFLPFYAANISFYLILVNLYTEYRHRSDFQESMRQVFRGYVWFFVLNAASVCIMQVLVNFTGMDPMINEITDRYDLFASNQEKFGSHYYFPHYLSVVLADSELRIPLFQDKGLLLGFFHEPHSFMFYITPVALFCIFTARNKTLSYSLSAILLLLILSCGSVTNILAILASLTVFFVIRNKKRILLLVTVIVFAIIGIMALDPDIYAFILYRFTSGSADYSKTTLDFAFMPRTIMGTNFLDLSYWDHGMLNYDVGYIPFILNLLFLLFFIWGIIRLLLNKDQYLNVLGMISLYFLLHSAKQAMVTYTIPLLCFIMFLLKAGEIEMSRHGSMNN